VYNVADWPIQDIVPDIQTNEVLEWMTELDGFYIPDISPTVDGTCANDPTAAAQAATNGWWTCGGYTRVTDITACPDKMTWGVSFDDGPSAYTQTLLNYLSSKSLQATFFVVGSRVIERPEVLIEEYMTGNEISVHTWSHHPLTSLTTQQIVAELGWTRKAIKNVLGITPTTMRPPYGDIDDRVRAISMAMGLTPIIWTRTPSGGVFDTNDWRVAAGEVTGLQSFATFQTILNNATQLDTGFIVLEHDLFEITVDLAVGYTLDSALTHDPSFTLEPIGKCMNIPATDLYMETTTNKTFPYHNHTYDIDGESTPGNNSTPGIVKIGGKSGSSNAAPIVSIPIFTASWFIALAAFSSFL
jgi:peptidoglycan/xylan/chitin deacetylase (PgdA/CDA1 family)